MGRVFQILPSSYAECKPHILYRVCGLSEEQRRYHEQVSIAGCVTVTMMSISWDNVQNRIQDLRESQISGRDVNKV